MNEPLKYMRKVTVVQNFTVVLHERWLCAVVKRPSVKIRMSFAPQALDDWTIFFFHPFEDSGETFMPLVFILTTMQITMRSVYVRAIFRFVRIKFGHVRTVRTMYAVKSNCTQTVFCFMRTPIKYL